MASVGQLYGIGQSQYRQGMEKRGFFRPLALGTAVGSLTGMGRGLMLDPTPERGTGAHIGMGAAGGALVGAALTTGALLGSRDVSKAVRSLADEAARQVRGAGDDAAAVLKETGEGLLGQARTDAQALVTRASEEAEAKAERVLRDARFMASSVIDAGGSRLRQEASNAADIFQEQRRATLEEAAQVGSRLLDDARLQFDAGVHSASNTARDYGQNVLAPQVLGASRDAVRGAAQGILEGAGQAILPTDSILRANIGGPTFLVNPRVKSAAERAFHDFADAEDLEKTAAILAEGEYAAAMILRSL